MPEKVTFGANNYNQKKDEKMSKKKTAKKLVKKLAKKSAMPKKTARKKKATPEELFGEWWNKNAIKKVDKIEKDWLKSNEPNDEEDDGGGDDWHVNQMMHNGDAHDLTYEIAERVFLTGYKGNKWGLSMEDSLFCELDEIICDAYLAGKESVS